MEVGAFLQHRTLGRDPIGVSWGVKGLPFFMGIGIRIGFLLASKRPGFETVSIGYGSRVVEFVSESPSFLALSIESRGRGAFFLNMCYKHHTGKLVEDFRNGALSRNLRESSVSYY